MRPTHHSSPGTGRAMVGLMRVQSLLGGIGRIMTARYRECTVSSLRAYLLVFISHGQLQRGSAQHVCTVDIKVPVMEKHEA